MLVWATAIHDWSVSRRCYLDQLLKSFWDRWREDYLLEFQATPTGKKDEVLPLMVLQFNMTRTISKTCLDWER